MTITESAAALVLQIGIILFAAKILGRFARLAGIPPFFGELLSGVIIGPYALGGVPLPGFAAGIFPAGAGTLAAGGELYAFAAAASIVLLFASGLETDPGLFLRCPFAGGVIGLGGAAFSFAAGDLAGALLLHADFMDSRCLFLGIAAAAASPGITARVLSGRSKIHSPEGAAILSAAASGNVLTVILLTVVLGIAPLTGAGGVPGAPGILAAAGKALGICLGFTAAGLFLSGRITWLLKHFNRRFDFFILSLGTAFLLAGFFGKQGTAMIAGAYIAGLSLSRTDIAPAIQPRVHGLREFFVPLLFSVMGMTVNVRETASGPALAIAALYAASAIAARILGCGGAALLLGFNGRGALRVGAGIAPRGEAALIIAWIALSSGLLDGRLFGVIVLMTFITTLSAPPLLSAFFKTGGAGAKKAAKDGDTVCEAWDFSSRGLAGMVTDALLKDLRNEGFSVQTLDTDEGLSLARKDDTVLSISEEENTVTIETRRADMPFVKTAVYELILGLGDAVEKLKQSSDPLSMKKELAGMNGSAGGDILSLVESECITLALKGADKKEVLTELVDLLDSRGKLDNRDMVLEDIFRREETMSTGMQHGVALPHARSGGVSGICAAVGVKKEGIDFDSLDGEKTRLFIMVISPREASGPHVQFLAAIGTLLRDEILREEVINAPGAEYAAALLRRGA